jgi:hypothetical protein
MSKKVVPEVVTSPSPTASPDKQTLTAIKDQPTAEPTDETTDHGESGDVEMEASNMPPCTVDNGKGPGENSIVEHSGARLPHMVVDNVDNGVNAVDKSSSVSQGASNDPTTTTKRVRKAPPRRKIAPIRPPLGPADRRLKAVMAQIDDYADVQQAWDSTSSPVQSPTLSVMHSRGDGASDIDDGHAQGDDPAPDAVNASDIIDALGLSEGCEIMSISATENTHSSVRQAAGDAYDFEAVTPRGDAVGNDSEFLGSPVMSPSRAMLHDDSDLHENG